MGSTVRNKSLPLQVAAVCYRKRPGVVEFLLVRTNGGNKWTFPKGSIELGLSHSQAAEREALEEAGALGTIEGRHFHLYLHSKGIFWQPGGVQEYLVKAFLMEATRTQKPVETLRNPTWWSAADARQRLSEGREVKYAAELQSVIDEALVRLNRLKVVVGPRDTRSARAGLL